MGWYDWLQKRTKWVEEKLDPTPGNRIANWSFNTVDPWAKRNIINPVSGYLGDAMAKSNERWQGAYGQITTPQGRKLWSEQFTGGAGASNRNVRAREAELGRKLTREEKLGWTQDYLAGRKTRAQEAWQAAPGPSYHMGWMPSWSPVKQVGVKGAWEAVNPELGGGAIGAGEAVGAVGARLGGNAARSLSYGMRGEGLLAPAERIAGAAASRGVGGAVERAGLRITALEELPGRALGSAFRRGGTELRPTGALDNVTMNSTGAMDNVSFANAAEDAGIPHSVQRIDEPGVTGGVEKPQGLYTSPSDVASPHADLGGEARSFNTNPNAKILHVAEPNAGRLSREMPHAGESAGVSAARKLVGDKEVLRMLKTRKGELISELTAKYPDVGWGKYYDQQEMVEAVAGIEARKQGYDAIFQTAKDRADDEFVALTDRAFAQNLAPEASTIGHPPIVPPGASGDVVAPTSVVPAAPMGDADRAMAWLGKSAQAQKEARAEVAKPRKAIVGIKAGEMDAAWAAEGDAITRAKGAIEVLYGKGKVIVEVPTDPIQKADLEYLVKRLEARADFDVFDRTRAVANLFEMTKGRLIEPKELLHVTSLLPEIADVVKYAPKWYQGLVNKAGAGLRETSSALRTLKTMGDLSIQLRQAFPMLFVDPKAYAKGTIEGVRSLKRFMLHEDADAVFNAIVEAHATHKMAPIAQYAERVTKSSADITGLVGKDFTKREEYFAGNVIDKIPGLSGVKHVSELHFASVANKVRSDAYYRLVERWAAKYPELSGAILKSGDLAPELYAEKATQKALTELHDIGKLVNVLTGRGDLGMLEKYAPTLQTLFFAPKYTAAAIESIPYSVVMAIRSPILRKEVAKGFVGLAATMGTIYGLAEACGGTVEMDTRSTDWGKLRIGDTRINLLGGLQPIVRYTAQIVTGERKSASGEIYQSSRGEDLARFLRSKLSPAAGLVTDMWSGETFIGEDADLSKESVARTAWQAFVPMFVQDVIDGWKQEGVEGAGMGATGFLGTSVTSYGPESKQVKDYRDEVSQKAYGMDWETLGKTRGKLYQSQLEESDSRLKQIVEDQRAKRLKEAGVPETAWDRYYGANQQITEDTDYAVKVASDAMMQGRITPKQFRERVDEIMGQARQARDWMETDPQYATVRQYLQTSGDSAVPDIAYNEYINQVYANDLTNELGKYDYAEAETRKQTIKAKYGTEVYGYIQQRLASGRTDDPIALQQLRQARETLKPYWQIEDKAWAMYPQWKEINDQITLLDATDPDQARRILKRYPQIVAIRKRIALEKKRMKATNPLVAQALIFYR